MNNPDHPDLTAYALGELDAEHAETMSRWVAENAEAGAEVDALNDLCQRLQSTAPIAMDMLHPHQRDAIMTGPQRVRKMVAAAKASRRRPSFFAPLAYGFSRAAAAAVLVTGGYMAGTHVSGSKPTVAATPAAPTPASVEVKPTTTAVASVVIQPPFKAKEVPQVVTAPPPVEPAAKPVQEEAVAVAPPKVEITTPAVEVVVASLPPALLPAKELAKPAMPKTQVLSESFVSTTKSTLAQVTLRPAETRHVVPRSNEAVAAAPLVHAAKAIEAVAHGKQPDLLIHSWKSEVASCPWNEEHRLLRVTIQIPGDQPAAQQAASYPLQVTFSPNHVRSYRQICQRSIPAAAVDAPAFHIVWYEFQPNGQASEAATKIIGTATLSNSRFTTAAAGPFDGSKLHLLDRGADLNAAKDDFLFESAVVGFGLLLKGEKDTGELNHSLVLDLAKRAAGADRNGERARFVKLVEDAEHSTGL